jgi:hypothetical protein
VLEPVDWASSPVVRGADGSQDFPVLVTVGMGYVYCALLKINFKIFSHVWWDKFI